jgi:hypothetical protein
MLLLVAGGGRAPSTQTSATVHAVEQVPAPAPPVSPDVAVFIERAIEDRYAWRAIPDGRNYGSPRAYLQRELIGAKLTLTAEAVPQREGTEFVLLSREEARALADKTKAGIDLIYVDAPLISGDTATLTIGTTMVMPSAFRGGVQGGCESVGEFKKTDGRWRFVPWVRRICG